MNLPKVLVIGGHKIKVKVKKLEAGVFGEYVDASHTIFIAKGLKEDQIRPTLFHECIHAALHVSGVTQLLTEEVEEAIAHCLEHSIYPLMGSKKASHSRPKQN